MCFFNIGEACDWLEGPISFRSGLFTCWGTSGFGCDGGCDSGCDSDCDSDCDSCFDNVGSLFSTFDFVSNGLKFGSSNLSKSILYAPFLWFSNYL